MYDINQLAEQVVTRARAKGIKLITLESCTGGMLAGYITSVSGSSEAFEYGLVTYSNEAKHKFLSVSYDLLTTYGAVSKEVAAAMLENFKNLKNTIAVSITGIAGPNGGSEEKPVGLVYIGISDGEGMVEVKEFRFKGNREEIRKQSCEEALNIYKNVILL